MPPDPTDPSRRASTLPALARVGRVLARAVGVAWLPDQVQADRDRIDDLERVHDTTAQTAGHAAFVAATANADATAALEQAGRALASALPRGEVLDTLHQHAIELDRLRRTQAVLLTMRWLEHLPVDPTTKISIVLPTRDRAAILGDAVRSVQAQSHPNWELVVVDDASVDDTRAVLAAFDDPRITVHEGPGRGASVARNLGLDQATGEIVTYLDDDNRFDPLWCQALAWAFTEHPDATMCYGARLIDSIDRVLASGPTPFGDMPTLQFEPFHRPTLERGNFIDMGVIAHRADPRTRFDEDLWWFGDWDLALTLTEECDPIELPVIAVHYTSDPIPRLSDAVRAGSARYEEEAERLRAKHRARAAARAEQGGAG